MKIHYTREQLEALRDWNVEPPPGLDDLQAGMYALEQSNSGRSNRSKRRRNKWKNSRATKRPREGELSQDEDGDFGGMFDERDIFHGVFVEENVENESVGAEGTEEENAGECYDDIDDEDEYDHGPMQSVAFVVEGEPDFEKEEPDDGWEYIRRVKWEAARCPGLKVATISPEKLVDRQTSYMPVVPDVPACDPVLLPTRDWEGRFLRSFSELRARFESWESPQPLSSPVPTMNDDRGWKVFCFGSKDIANEQAGVSVSEELEGFGAGPLMFYKGELNRLLNLDEVTRAFLFRKQVAWLKGMEYLPRERALWLFALTAAVDKPIDADTGFAMRTLWRSCSSIRASKRFQDDSELQLLNMIITVAGKYFGQDDTHCF